MRHGVAQAWRIAVQMWTHTLTSCSHIERDHANRRARRVHSTAIQFSSAQFDPTKVSTERAQTNLRSR